MNMTSTNSTHYDVTTSLLKPILRTSLFSGVCEDQVLFSYSEYVCLVFSWIPFVPSHSCILAPCTPHHVTSLHNLLHSMSVVGILGLVSKLHEWNKSAVLFSGTGMVVYPYLLVQSVNAVSIDTGQLTIQIQLNHTFQCIQFRSLCRICPAAFPYSNPSNRHKSEHLSLQKWKSPDVPTPESTNIFMIIHQQHLRTHPGVAKGAQCCPK